MITYHIINVPRFEDNIYEKQCSHKPNYVLEDKSFLPSNSRAAEKLRDMFTKESLQEDIKRATNHQHTGHLESVNALITKCAPKNPILQNTIELLWLACRIMKML